MADDADRVPEFEISQRPERRYPPEGGVKYQGTTVFRLVPEAERSDSTLTGLVTGMFETPDYTAGDWFDLPMPLYLVHDEERGDVFRVAVRDGAVELHVLPETRAVALRDFYEQLREASDLEWAVERKSG